MSPPNHLRGVWILCPLHRALKPGEVLLPKVAFLGKGKPGSNWARTPNLSCHPWGPSPHSDFLELGPHLLRVPTALSLPRRPRNKPRGLR